MKEDSNKKKFKSRSRDGYRERTLNELRQVKDSHYVSPHTPVERSIAYLCAVYPNDTDLGAIIRKHFAKNVKRK